MRNVWPVVSKAISSTITWRQKPPIGFAQLHRLHRLVAQETMTRRTVGIYKKTLFVFASGFKWVLLVHVGSTVLWVRKFPSFCFSQILASSNPTVQYGAGPFIFCFQFFFFGGFQLHPICFGVLGKQDEECNEWWLPHASCKRKTVGQLWRQLSRIREWMFLLYWI